jgi:hypothetical protein
MKHRHLFYRPRHLSGLRVRQHATFAALQMARYLAPSAIIGQDSACAGKAE